MLPYLQIPVAKYSVLEIAFKTTSFPSPFSSPPPLTASGSRSPCPVLFLSTSSHPSLYTPLLFFLSFSLLPLFSFLISSHFLFSTLEPKQRKPSSNQGKGVLYPSCGKHSLLMTTFLFSHFIRGSNVIFSTTSFSSGPGQVSTNVLCGPSGNGAKKKLTQLLPGL